MAQLTTSKDKFQFKLDRLGKKFHIKGIGNIEPEDAEYFVSEYNNTIKGIKTSDYELVFDCTELRLAGKDMRSGADMTASLKGCLTLYKSNGFNNIVFDCKGNLPMGMQLKRLGREVQLEKFEVLS